MSSKPANLKKRNNEKRKEKSREAARCRRTKETQIFNELTAALPAKKEEVEQLDKASVMRLAISYLRVRDVASMLQTDNPEQPCLQSPKGLEEVSSEQSYMKALDGFVLVMSQQGDIVYCSENIAEHLGVSQMEMMGQSVFEFSHPCDHDEIRDALRSHDHGRRELLVRFKCTLTSKGRNVHLKSASYKVIRVTGHMLGTDDKAVVDHKPTLTEDKKIDEIEKKLGKVGSLVAVGRPIPHPSNIEVPLDSKTFLTKHSLDMKITYTDDALMKTFGFEPDELNGHSLYDYHHAADSASLIHIFKSLFSKGQCETGQYRFLAKSGGYAWVQTQATVITDKQQKPISVVCVNYVISGIECKDEVFAAHQVHNADLKPKVLPAPIETCEPTEVANGAVVSIISSEKERPIPVTKLIFAPRQKEMNKGFLMFSQDEGQTMLKDDPEDLSHLAPTAGDACIPLGSSSFEFLDEFELLNNSYCPIWGEDLPNGSPVDSLPNDSLLLSSPEPHESDSSCEKSSLLTDLSLDPFDSNRSDNEDGEQSAFIPSNDDLPVLEPAVMWGALPDNVSLAKPQPSEVSPTSPHSPALQRLLAAPPTGPLPQDLITNIYSDQGLIPSRSLTSWETGVKRVITKQDDEPYPAKRVKRCPSPAKSTTSTSSSSVLMNLLDMQLKASRQFIQKPAVPYVNNTFLQIPSNIPLPVINIMHSMPSNQEFRANQNTMSPLSVNINNSMYSLPSSPITPNYSPVMSPAPRDCVPSAYSTPQSLSPVGRQLYSPNTLLSPSGALHGSDPYLNKMQVSPNYHMQPVDLYLEPTMSPCDFWNDAEMLQGPNDLLSALDDVKLV